MKTEEFLSQLVKAQKSGSDKAEATANQVNQFGGYTGMKPDDFMAFVRHIAAKVGFDENQLIVGGDHLGPLTWKNEAEDAAMEKAEELIRQYVAVGFSKIHLDTSMRLADDSDTERLSDATIAKRAARLCAAAEASHTKPVYVIGSEVPVPGGATENEDSIAVTSPEDLNATLNAFKKAFNEKDLSDAWQRVVAVVVQPGVEFADPDKAQELINCAKALGGIILEGHSTDYQPKAALDLMRRDGIGILKVGPALTFALREALFALEEMERILYPFSPKGGYSYFGNVLEGKLMSNDKYWKSYYHGSE